MAATKPAARKLEHNQQATRLLRGYILALGGDAAPLVQEWRDWFDQDEALRRPKLTPATTKGGPVVGKKGRRP